MEDSLAHFCFGEFYSDAPSLSCSNDLPKYTQTKENGRDHAICDPRE